MDALQLSYFSLSGFTLNAEEQSVLSSSLTVKKAEEKFDNVQLVAKIIGVKSDYFLAFGHRQDVFERKFFYCVDMLKWLELPAIEEKHFAAAATVKARFSGDPSFEYRADINGEQIVLSEEKRLACTIREICHDSEIIPRGAYFRNLHTDLAVNPSFTGLLPTEIGNASSYLHFRPGYDINKQDIIERGENFVESIDIFEPISKDTPKGVWSLQTERSGSVAIVKNLQWPGHVFFHVPEQGKFSNFYFGTGQKNHNLAFML